jgi:hypothetical protein
MRKRMMIPMVLTAILGPAHAGDVSGKGLNGGRVSDAGNMHVEFVSKGADVSVFTFDHDNKPIPSAGMTGRVTVQEQGKTRSVDLASEASNRLTGKLDGALGSGARVIVSVTPNGGKPVQARYTVN